MIDHRVAAATDVGRVRSGNEDAYHRGDLVYAVADGMGGHVAGEVASKTALEPLADLDGKVFPDGQAAVDALRDAIVEANLNVAEKARAQPELRGMGTTLTAALLEGRRLHIGHVGDSRAYLLRGRELTQLTTDHTLVQHLIDEGQITPDEAKTHPQRSIITRAIGVSLEVEVDTLSLDVEPGDTFLLCSDGLTGVVSDSFIARAIQELSGPDRVVEALIDAANDRGGPDNITVILLDFAPEDGFAAAPPSQRLGSGDADTGPMDAADLATDDDDETDEDAGGAVLGGAAAAGAGRQVIRSSSSGSSDSWAEQLGRFGAGRRGDADARGDRATRGPRVMVGALVALLLLGAAAGSGRWLLSRSFYVGVADGQVAIYRGIPATLGPVSLHWLDERTDLAVDELPEFIANDVRDGRAAASLVDARNIVENLRRRAEESPTPTATPSAAPSPDLTASPSPRSPGAAPPSPDAPSPDVSPTS